MKNKQAKRLKLAKLFMVLLLLQATVKAGVYLPESSTWQGARYYNQNNVYAYVEYAVYDTTSEDYDSSYFEDFTGTGQYLYAYQAFNLGSGLPPIATFELLGGDPSLVNGIGYQDDESGGIIPTNNGTSFIWTFTNGFFVVDEHSAFMVFGSDFGPVAGDFMLSTEYGDEPPANGSEQATDIPEPITVVLLAAGAFGLIKRK